ncbi:MAG: YggT family protein [Fusobacterium gastrosuis]|uniref:YggT family protein n=1 Tax=Fusobacterium TaxID=848 RepID=UPI001F4FBD0E|nr:MULTISPECIES: YggT family protein [Fusobacterium]MDD7392136.1 YggT family protein [Fusobacteriaceae bacterium]MCI7224137.1 YggT family protein [Fusobacterium sp.]MDD7409753.1 YggT family protein [Fusobacteriaceae bacterium]MDY4011086.1 YggT family protein [Fusobacterium gastrosuis]MDY5305055.1 YggT family protein [Fusobacterium gastrosuis]
MFTLIYLVNKIEIVLEILLGLRFLTSWLMPRTRNAFTDTLYSLTEPLLAPFRSVISFGNMGIDLAPIILIFILRTITAILYRAVSLFMF